MGGRRIAAALLTLALLLSVIPGVRGESQEDAKQELDRLQEQNHKLEQEIGDLRDKLSENLSQIEDAAARKSLIDQEIFLLHEQITNTGDQLTAYTALIADKQAEVDAAQVRLEQLRSQNKARIRAMEKNGKIRYWSVLFKADSFIDLLDRLRMIEQLVEADRLRFTEMNRAAQALAQAKTDLEEEKQALQTAQDSLRTTQNELQLKRQEAQSLLSGLLERGQEYEALLEASEQKQENLADRLAEANEAYESTQEETPAKPQSGTSTGNGAGSTTWLVPMRYDAVTSPFGDRWHPLSGEWKLHKGVDLAAAEGTPIYATRSGTVTTAAFEDGGAGFYVSISHGGGYASIYMHMTHFVVSAGQHVDAGQLIGYCGSTGGSTGPHLHFGISKNGVYVNPANYIPI